MIGSSLNWNNSQTKATSARVCRSNPALQRVIYQKQGRSLRGMIDRSHQQICEVALRNKLKSLGYWIR